MAEQLNTIANVYQRRELVPILRYGNFAGPGYAGRMGAVMAVNNFEDNPAQSTGTLVGLYLGGPLGGAMGDLIRGEAVNEEFFRSVA